MHPADLLQLYAFDFDNMNAGFGVHYRNVGRSSTASNYRRLVKKGRSGSVERPGEGKQDLPLRCGAGFSGIDTFTYTVGDGHGGTATATVTMTVGAPPVVNQPPTARDERGRPSHAAT